MPAPAQRTLRLLCVCVPLWLPLWVQAAEVYAHGLVQSGIWHMQMEKALELMGFGLDSTLLALQRGDTRAAESWKSCSGARWQSTRSWTAGRSSCSGRSGARRDLGSRERALGNKRAVWVSSWTAWSPWKGCCGCWHVLGLDVGQPLAAQVEDGEMEEG